MKRTFRMRDRTQLGEKILKHWTAHWPQLVRELERTKDLQRILHDTEERTADILYELVSVQKLDYQAAWEIAMQEWTTLPSAGRPSSSETSKRLPS